MPAHPAGPALWKSVALLLVLALCWGGAYTLTKVAVETLPPLTVAAVRAALAAACLLAFLGPRVRELARVPRPRHAYLLQGMLNCVLPWALVSWASQIIDSSVTTILNSLSPIFIFLITWGITRHEPATGRKLFGAVLGLAGVFAIVGLNTLQGLGAHTAAELACVLGSLSYAIGGIVGRRFDRVSPVLAAAGATLMAAVVLVPLALAVEQPWTFAPSTRSLVAVTALAIFSTGIPFVIYFRLLSTLGSIGTASQAYLRILIGAALGVVFLGEQLSANTTAGLVLVIAAVIAMTMPQRRAPARAWADPAPRTGK
jgi:drug/metabolite transporter (DMT)-like permease